MADDSTDWSGTRAPFLEKFEEKLRCPICREILRRAPTMTECGHTFCGECLGRHLNSEKTCPLCRVEIQRAKLRLNKIIEDLADDWCLTVRQQLMDALPVPARASQTPPAQVDGRLDSDNTEVVDLSSDPPTQSSTLPEGYAICPICARALPIAEIEGKHIDGCLRNRTLNGSTEPPRKKRAVFGSTKDLEKLTIPFYPGLSEAKLKNLLKDAQLSTKGGKQRLVARHQEWVNIWNTNLLSRRPRSPGELRQMMAQWDRSQEQSSSGSATLKDLDATQYIEQHKASYNDLAQRAREAGARQKKSDEPSV